MEGAVPKADRINNGISSNMVVIRIGMLVRNRISKKVVMKNTTVWHKPIRLLEHLVEQIISNTV